MSRAYLRLSPGFYERKLEQGYTLPQIAAYVGCLCLADSQTNRGRFRDVGVLKALLGRPAARQLAALFDRGDLLVVERGRVYVDGWDEWQEGDWQVKERLARVRGRKSGKATAGTVSVDTHLAESVAIQNKAEQTNGHSPTTYMGWKPKVDRLPGEAIALVHDGKHRDAEGCGVCHPVTA